MKKKSKAKENLLDKIKKLSIHQKYLLTIVVFLMLIAILFANGDVTKIEEAMKELCTTARSVLAVGTMLMVILSAVVYAVGQILGAETRARAAVWATAMMTGAVVGILIYIIVPYLVDIMAPGLGIAEACTGTAQDAGDSGSTTPKLGDIPKTIPIKR